MKTFLLAASLGITLLFMGACSPSSDNNAKTMGPTPNPENLKADSERLRQATEKAAEARRNTEKLPVSTPTPAP